MSEHVESAVLTQTGDDASSRERGVIVRTVPLGGSRLSLALQSETDQSHDARPSWLAARPRTMDEWRDRARNVASSAMSNWHDVLAPAFAATGKAAERLARSAANGIVVTTGQQPGLFGGPTYTWTKAVSALAFADRLEAETGIPVAPVFWAATDDADWEEASVTHVLTARGLQTLRPASPRTEGVAMMDVPLGDVSDAFAALRGACGSAALLSVLDEVAAAYLPDATVGSAYLDLLRALLEPLGIAVLDASHPALREAADPFLRHALLNSAAVSQRLAERTEAIRGAGYEPQVDVMDALSLVFQTSPGASGRNQDRVRERIALADAARGAREAPVGTLGANVLLRPVLERHLLPTIAYLAGPGELAYFAQVSPIAEALGAQVPLPLPRWAGEVIETRSIDLLAELGLDESSLRDPHAAESMLARQAIPEDGQDALERLRVTLDTQIRALGAAVSDASGIVHPDVIEGLKRDLMHRVERFERRVVAGIKRREDTLMQEIAHVRGAFRPLGSSPERVLNLIPFLARHGGSVFTSMHREAEAYFAAMMNASTSASASTSAAAAG